MKAPRPVVATALRSMNELPVQVMTATGAVDDIAARTDINRPIMGTLRKLDSCILNVQLTALTLSLLQLTRVRHVPRLPYSVSYMLR